MSKGLNQEQLEAVKKEKVFVAKYNAYKCGEVSWKEYGSFAIQVLDNYVKKLISKYHKTAYGEYEDLTQSAYEKIIEHLKDYDPNKTEPTTFFDPYIKEGLKNDNKDGSKHYESVIVKLNRVAQEAGYVDCFDSLLTPQMLSILSGKPLKTVVKALEYKQETTLVSLEAVSENQDIESPFDSPEAAYIKRERRDLISKLFETQLTSFEKWLITNRLEDVSNNYMLGKLKDDSFKVLFEDDEVATKAKFNKDYLDSRYYTATRKLAGNPIIRNYGSLREKYLFCADDEQASYDDIQSAFEDEDNLFGNVG
nr:hypothetical protein [uncultured Butyrivibrio sp.]